MVKLACSDREMPVEHQGNPLDNALYSSVFWSALQLYLRYEDRNSMAFSIKSRLPFLDVRLVEYAFELPLSAKIDNGWTKAILRNVMRGKLPDVVRLRRDKMGFPTPEVEWLTQDNGKTLLPILEDLKTHSSGAIDFEILMKQARHLIAHPEQKIGNIWRYISFELWHNTFFANST